VLDLAGNLTFNDGTLPLRNRVRELVDSGRRRVLLNLGGVTDMDSAGLGELVQSYVATTRQHGQLKLLNVPRHVRQLLAATKLATIFESFENEKAALDSFETA